MDTDTPYRTDSTRDNVIRLELTYDGPDVAAGTMDAYTLGAAIQALAEYIDASASLLYGAGSTVTHEIEANFRRGSFTLLVFSLTPEQADAGLSLLHYLTSKEFYEILGLTGGGGGGVLGLVAFLKGRKPKEVAPGPSAHQLTVTGNEGQTTVINAHTLNLYNNPTVRERVEGVVAPLQRDGIKEFRASELGGEVETVITQPEVVYFEPPAPVGETLQDKVLPEIVTVASLSFDQGRKWKFRLGDGNTFTSALDENFAKRVARHEVVFGAGDALELLVRTVVTRDEAGQLYTHRNLVRVVRLIPAQKLQLGLDFGSDKVFKPDAYERLTERELIDEEGQLRLPRGDSLPPGKRGDDER